jgi:hypothetical protein
MKNFDLHKDSHTVTQAQTSSQNKSYYLNKCCINSLKKHVDKNTMISCPDCRFIIKCFSGEDQYKNYVMFCKSRQRQIETTKYQDYFIVCYRAYEPFKKIQH